MKNKRTKKFTMTDKEKAGRRQAKTKIIFIPKFKSVYDKLLYQSPIQGDKE